MYNSNTFISIPNLSIFGLCRDASNNKYAGFYISVSSDQNVQVIVMEGNVTANSNDYGMYFRSSGPNTKLDIDVKEDGSFQSCGNSVSDIYANSVDSSASVEFTGSGYTCSSKSNDGSGTVVGPNCQACPE